jgi:hypothetical protein
MFNPKKAIISRATINPRKAFNPRTAINPEETIAQALGRLHYKVFKTASTLEKWQADLRRAGIEYTDYQGRIAGLHSLRAPLGTNLEQLGALRAVRNWIMRHVDPSVSYTSYVDRQRLDAWEWVNRLPSYSDLEAAEKRRAGTDDLGVVQLDQKLDQSPCSNVHFGSSRGTGEKERDISASADSASISACFEGDGGNSPSRTRTYNLAVNSRSLYH